MDYIKFDIINLNYKIVINEVITYILLVKNNRRSLLYYKHKRINNEQNKEM